MIHDIFPPVTIPDNSLYLFLLLLFCGLLLGCALLLFFYKMYHKRKNTQILQYLKILHKCDFTDAKQSAFKIDYYISLLADTDNEKSLLKKMQALLLPYKYRDIHTTLPQELQDTLKLFIKSVEERIL